MLRIYKRIMLFVMFPGGGDATVYAISQLDAHASGGGDIRYKGNPKTDTSCSGGGDIHHIN